ncbi:hypothetical protein H0H87_004039, partial [Tephrocybe sp. NHM501043]
MGRSFTSTFHQLCRLVTFQIPFYLSSQAITILRDIEGLGTNSEDNRTSLSRPTDCQINTGSIEFGVTAVPCLALPEDAHIPSHPHAWMYTSLLPSSSNSSALPVATNLTFENVEAGWIAYVERRLKEWSILLTLTGAILV